MTIRKTYSSWTRNRLDPATREAIRNAGPGTVDFMAAHDKPVGWVGCRITTPEGGMRQGVGPNPLAAFQQARMADLVRAIR